MAHFAKIENGVVVTIAVVSNDDIIDENGNESEELGQAFLQQHVPGIWVQTSFNNNFRGRYAERGGLYDAELDIFVPRQIYPSWSTYDEEGNWIPPVPYPESSSPDEYSWDESKQEWVKNP